MNDKITIGAAVKDDFPRWKPLWEGYNGFYGRVGETALSPEITQMTWSHFFDEYEPKKTVRHDPSLLARSQR